LENRINATTGWEVILRNFKRCPPERTAHYGTQTTRKKQNGLLSKKGPYRTREDNNAHYTVAAEHGIAEYELPQSVQLFVLFYTQDHLGDYQIVDDMERLYKILNMYPSTVSNDDGTTSRYYKRHRKDGSSYYRYISGLDRRKIDSLVLEENILTPAARRRQANSFMSPPKE
jgi:hypothetical protein